jgi:hypothetical protein
MNLIIVTMVIGNDNNSYNKLKSCPLLTENEHIVEVEYGYNENSL